jgi:hypothetical protein
MNQMAHRKIREFPRLAVQTDALLAHCRLAAHRCQVTITSHAPPVIEHL